MRSNKVESGTVVGVYCMMHDVKGPFCMIDFSSSNIINHRFHVDKYKIKSGIFYEIIIVRYIMVQLDLKAKFKHQFLQWDGATVHRN